MRHLVCLEQASLPLADLTQWQQLPFNVQCYPYTHPADVVSRAQSAEILVVNKTKLTAELLAQLPELRLICVTATGVNTIDLAAAERLGIIVCNAQDYALQAVPQHAIALLLSLANQITCYHRAIAKGEWSQSQQFCLLDFPIQQLAGLNFCVLGYGGLGQATAKLAAAFGMHVLIAERPEAKQIRAGRIAFRAALEMADVISLHCPATEDNFHLFNRERLSWLKSSALLINTARGSLIDPVALADALRHGSLAGAALDVLDIEPPPPEHPLLAADIPNLVLSPHVGWANRHTMQSLVDQMTANILAYLAGKPLRQCRAIPMN